MTENDNTPVFDPSTDSDSPVEETATSETPAEETPAEETPEVSTEPEPVEVSPEAPENETTPVEVASETPELDAQPVSGVPTPGAVSDQPEQTDNRERPEDGEQDVSQDPNVVPSDDEDPDVVA